jgi:ATP-dependent HslUV protease ATP-binding subunit HslU
MQYRELLGTENLQIAFSDDAVQRIAQIAFQVNERTENIGARRLHTVMEKLLEDISFDAADVALRQAGAVLSIDAARVEAVLGEVVQDEDLSRYIL